MGDKNGVKGYDHQSVIRINSREGATANRRHERQVARKRLSRELGQDPSESSFVIATQLQMATRPRKELRLELREFHGANRTGPLTLSPLPTTTDRSLRRAHA